MRAHRTVALIEGTYPAESNDVMSDWRELDKYGTPSEATCPKRAAKSGIMRHPWGPKYHLMQGMDV